MATTNYDIGHNAWVSVATGPQSGSVTNHSEKRGLGIRIENSAPTDGDCEILGPREHARYTLNAGEQLYIGSDRAGVVGVTVDT